MAPSRAGPGPLRKLWLSWKMLQLPWRRRKLIGYDLQGNTFWEFKDQLHAQRNRRIVEYSRQTHHSDVHVPPQWMQWLRHTRYEPPTIQEQQAEVLRQAQMKQLAAAADARWAAKPSFLDAPDKQQPASMLESRDKSSGLGQGEVNGGEGRNVKAEPTLVSGVTDTEALAEETTDQQQEQKKTVTEKEPKDSPWKQAQKGNPGDDWQPKEWAPAPSKRRG